MAAMIEPLTWTPGAPRRRAARPRVLWVILAALLSGCDESAAANPGATFVLVSYPGGDCPLAGAVDVTFKIDPNAPEAVIAVADDGMSLHVKWPPRFIAGTYRDPVVRDPAGRVVARDGQRLISPENGFPKLPGGWAVCFGGDSVWVQDHPLP